MYSEKETSSNKTTKYLIAISSIAVIAISLGYIYWISVVNKNSNDNEILQEANVIDAGDVTVEIDSGSENGVTIKQVPIEENNAIQPISIPDIDRLLVFDSSLSESSQIDLRENIDNLKELVKNNPERIDYWLDLGLYWKIAGDYEGAKIAWEYAASMKPQDSLIYSNLGRIYHFYLKDFPNAEKNFLEAIEKGPNSFVHYIDLHELYKFSYKQDTTSAADALIGGIAKNPDDTNLLIALAAYYKEKEDTINAKKYYEQARDEAQKLGDVELTELLNKEISN